MRRVESLQDLYEFLASVILCAPDRFRVEDFLPADEQMNLERSFEELRHGLAFVQERITDSSRLADLSRLLEESLGAYRAGDSVAGARALQTFEDIVFAQELAAAEAADLGRLNGSRRDA